MTKKINVFKFGGASVKDADAVRNVNKILTLFPENKIAIVVSAMGKSTNALEKIYNAQQKKDASLFLNLTDELLHFHKKILNELISDKTHPVFKDFHFLSEELKSSFSLTGSSAECYSHIVSFGELLSTKIINAFLQEQGFLSLWKDARKIIRSKENFKDSDVDWTKTEEFFKEYFLPDFEQYDILVTQGFIGHNSEGKTTTLGREGSDFTAGIIAYCCNAEDVTIWKDVPGMLNADPKWFKNTVKLDEISFKEAIELSYYGASVIHPKTLKPLRNKNIPLRVKSFLKPNDSGTLIWKNTKYDHLIPSYIFKMNQVLFSITPKDFSFVQEEKLSDIFSRIHQSGYKINIMQNSALNFSFLMDEDKTDIDELISLLQDEYIVKYNENLELITIRHYNDQIINELTNGKEIFLKQTTRETARIVCR